MASSIFTDTEKAAIADLLDNVHETFKKNIYVFVEEATSVGLDTNYNPLYNRYKDQSKAVTDKVLKKYTYEARVKYFKKSDEQVLNDTGLPSSENVIRIKVNNEAKEKIKIASSIEVDGEKYSVISDPEGIGPFSIEYYKIYLKLDS